MKSKTKKRSFLKARKQRSRTPPEDIRPPIQRLPTNIAFATALGAQLTQILSTKLAQLCKRKSFHELSHQMQFQFVCHSINSITGLSYSDAYQQLKNAWFTAKLDNKNINSLIDPDAFAERIAALLLPTSAIECPARQNLAWITQALHLTTVEQKVLLWSYSLSSRVECVQPIALRSICRKSYIESVHALAVLFDEPIEAMTDCYAGPCKLYGLHLLGAEVWGRFTTLDDLLTMPYFVVRWLETEYAHPSELLAALMRPEFHSDLLPDLSVFRTLLDLWLPPVVADAYETAAKSLPLSATHVAALLQWFTRCDLDTNALSGLAGKLDFETLLTTAKCYCFERSCAGQPMNTPDLLQILHLAIG